MFTFSTPKPLQKHKTRISFFSKWWKVIRVSVNVTTYHSPSGVHVASGQRSGEKVPYMAPHPAMKGPDISPSPEWKLHTYDGCRPSKGYDEKNSSVGLHYRPKLSWFHPYIILLPFIIPYLVFPFSLSSCLLALPSKAARKTLRCAKLAGLHKHRWNERQRLHCSGGHLSSW